MYDLREVIDGKSKIKISKSPTADTRTTKDMVDAQALYESSLMHIEDVQKAMNLIAELIIIAGKHHDWTKIQYAGEFYKQFHRAQQTGEWGKGWFDEIHIVNERHHLKGHVPDDVNLIDVIEMICDCVMAGLARSGKYRDEEPDPEVLVKAYKNTVKMLLDKIEVKD